MKCLIIYTPHAMKGQVKKYKQQIRTTLKQKFKVVDFLESKYTTNTSDIASSACGIYDCVIALGGDGTFNEVINGIAEKENKPVLAFLPCGTVNDLARSLKIPRKLDAALKVILDGHTFKHDIFKINNRYGIYVVAAGILTGCSYITGQENKRRFGWYAYAYEALKELFRKNSIRMKITCDKKTFDGSYAVMLLANSNSVAGINVNKNADLNDGLIDVILLRQFRFMKITNLISALRLIKIFIFKIKKIKNTKYFAHLKASEVTIENYSSSKLNVDGEYGGNDSIIKLKMLKEEIEIFAPKIK
ncbi:MAG: diacylglycerol kinase family lipid kinase [Clostridia bacterium]|nr:diacylglycerol kinase family lipid kinase [Clostridia bacterium]